MLESGEPEDLRTAAKLSSQGYRSYVWRQGATGRFGSALLAELGEDFEGQYVRRIHKAGATTTISESGLEYDATQEWLPDVTFLIPKIVIVKLFRVHVYLLKVFLSEEWCVSLRIGEEGEQEVMWEEFARMACNMVRSSDRCFAVC